MPATPYLNTTPTDRTQLTPATAPTGPQPDAHPDRQSRHLAAAGLYVTVCWLWLWIAKETPRLYDAQPWQDDPYDLIVSLDLVILPMLLAIGGTRLARLTTTGAGTTRRLVDLYATATLATGTCLATQLAQGVSVLLGDHRNQWDRATTAQCLVLAITTLTSSILTHKHRTTWRALRNATSATRTDGADDLSACLTSTRLPGAALIGRAADTARRRPAVADLVLTLTLWCLLMAPKLLIERYSLAALALSGTFALTTLYAAISILARSLNLVSPEKPRGRAPRLLTGTCAGAAFVFSFHDRLLAQPTPTSAALLLLAGAIAGAGVTLTSEAIHHRHAQAGAVNRKGSR